MLLRRQPTVAMAALMFLSGCGNSGEERNGASVSPVGTANGSAAVEGSREVDPETRRAAAALSVQGAPRDCNQSRTMLTRLVGSAGGAIQYRGGAEISIEETLWGDLPGYVKQSILRSVATAASCPSGNGETTILTVRATGSGRVLGRGTYGQLAQ